MLSFLVIVLQYIIVIHVPSPQDYNIRVAKGITYVEVFTRIISKNKVEYLYKALNFQ